MKLFAAATALAVVFACSPAMAQQSPPSPPAPTPEANATTGTVTVQGVPPSQVLGAIDTEKLVKEKRDAEAQAAPQEPLAKSADANGVTTKPDPNDKTHSDVQSASTGSVGVDTAELPKEVEVAISDGKYTTKDLVQAQLEFVQRQPVITPTTVGVITTVEPAPAASTPPPEQGAPVFDGATRPGNWSQSAETLNPPG